MLHLLVTGSRTWDDATYIWKILSGLYVQHKRLEIHHGQCPEGGADLHADDCGNSLALSGANVTVVRHPMNRQRYGKAAGPIRNSEMVEVIKRFMYQGEAVACHAFHRNNSRGTSDCAFKALSAGIPVVTHVWNGDAAIQTVVEEQMGLFPLPEAA